MESNRKRRVLFTGEASYLATGFSTYWNEVIQRLHATNEFEIAEMGSYAHADDQRCSQVPWKFYPVAPPRSDQQAMQKYQANPTNQFGEGIFDDVCLDFKPDIVCVPPGTKVETPSGVKNIEDIQKGELVISHTGKARKVLDITRRQHIGDVVKIYPHNDNQCYTFTPEHPILVIKSKKRTWKQRDVRDRHSVDDAKFVEARNLSSGDYVLIPIHRPEKERSNVLDTTCYFDQFIYDNIDTKVYPAGHQDYKKDHGIPKYIHITKRFARLLGYYCAEGSNSGNSISLDFGITIKENEYVKDVQSLIQDLFGLSTSVVKSKVSNGQSVKCCSVLIKELMGKMVGCGAHNKRIPDCIWKSNDIELIQSFLEGLIKGDGYYGPDTVSLSTVSETLARQVRMLFARIGVKASIMWKINKPSKLVKTERLSFDVECYGQSARLAHEFINKQSELLSRKSLNPKWIDKGGIGWIEDDYIVVPIRRIRTEQYHGQVYNLEVDQDNSYVTGFSVHNCSIRDWWMDEFILRSSVRHNFSFIWMPTIDGEPQRELWLDSYKQCDRILTYSKYGMQLLKKTGRKGTNLITIASPGADLDVFKPPDNKREHKQKLGIDPNSLIVGTVMRNQKRKLYYDLIEAFAMWVNRSTSKGHTELARKTFLYLHTSYPDVGYDIAKAIRDFKIGNKVIMTYLCSECNTAYPSFFSGEIMVCRKCGKLAAHPPNASHSCPRNVLADIIKSFDLYVQYSTCEGWGMPLTEAQACGVPTMAVRYSAMEDHLDNPTSIPIEVHKFFWEAIIETEQRRALPSNDDFVRKMDRFLKLSEDARNTKMQQTRAYIEEPVATYGQELPMKRRGWERTAAIWGQVIRETKIQDQTETWLCPTARLHNPNLTPPSNNMNNSEFINWVIGKVWNHPEMLHTHFSGEWLKALNSGSRTVGDRRVPFDRKMLVEHFMGLVQQANVVEEKRTSSLKKADPGQISMVVM
jgi:glycosyltransferase involved in cell wall biosynthesis/intein/homing endonuclease